MNTLGIVKEIYIYPIKSLPGIKLNKCLVTAYGIAHPDNPSIADRKWMIVTETGQFMTQRQIPRMALIQPRLHKDCMTLSAPNKSDLHIPMQATSEKITCRVWGQDVPGYLYDTKIGEWLSDFLGKPGLNLVTFTSDLTSQVRRVINIDPKCKAATNTDSTIYSDASPFMLISDKSLEDLNAKLEKKVGINQFRPNFYVQAAEAKSAYCEDGWGVFGIGGVEFKMIKHCTRCILTCVDPITGVRSADMQPLNTLKTFRTNKELYGHSPMFGIHCTLHNNPGVDDLLSISVNDLINN